MSTRTPEERRARIDRIRAAAETVSRRTLPALGPFGTITPNQEAAIRDDDRTHATDFDPTAQEDTD